METERIEIAVPAHKSKVRLDVFLAKEIARITRSQIQKLIKEGDVTVDGNAVKAHHIVQSSEIITVNLRKPSPPLIEPEQIPLEIVYEDAALLVVNKKAGMVVHPAYGHHRGTLVNALLAHCDRLSDLNSRARPGIVHRIDKDTSGLLVVAKDNVTHQGLAAQFMEKTVSRTYSAVVWGVLKEKTGTVETLLERSIKDRRKIRVSAQGKRAVTHFKVIDRFPLTSLLSLKLETGRTHQIRVHLAHLDHPVFGDQAYGGRGRRLGGLNQNDTALGVELLRLMPRQALHAKTLGFVHPKTGERIMFDSELPDDMARLLRHLSEARIRASAEPSNSR